MSTDRTYLVKPTDVGHVLKLEIQPCDAKAPAPNHPGVSFGMLEGDSLSDSSEEEFGPDSKERSSRTWDVYG